MSPLAYVQSCRRCAPLADVSGALLLAMYDDVASRPLQIAPSTPGESRHRVGASCGRAAGAHSFYSAAQGHTQHATPSEGEAVSTSGGAADPATNANAAGSDAAAGGGAWAVALASAQGGAAPPPREIVIDWSVAYWNLVDAARYVRSATWLFASRKANRMVDLLHTAWGWALLPLAVACAGVLVMLRPTAHATA